MPNKRRLKARYQVKSVLFTLRTRLISDSAVKCQGKMTSVRCLSFVAGPCGLYQADEIMWGPSWKNCDVTYCKTNLSQACGCSESWQSLAIASWVSFPCRSLNLNKQENQRLEGKLYSKQLKWQMQSKAEWGNECMICSILFPCWLYVWSAFSNFELPKQFITFFVF